METKPIYLPDIAKEVGVLSSEEFWLLWRDHVQTLEPFWHKTIQVFAERLNSPECNRKAQIEAVANAFQLMDDWRFQRIKYVKARRNEIETAISFILNKALQNQVAHLAIAPAARNAATALRVFLTASCRGYSDKQLPECFAHSIYQIAAVHTLFPFDFGSLASFHPGHSNPNIYDPFIAMLETSGQEMGIKPEVQALFAQVRFMWSDLNNPKPLNFHDTVWLLESNGLNAKLHYAAQRAFHQR